MPHYDRPKVDEIRNLTPAIVVDQHAIGANSRSTVGTTVDVAPLMRLLFSRVGNPSAGGSMAYSFNHPAGMCPDCTGIGEQMELNEDSMFDFDKFVDLSLQICFFTIFVSHKLDGVHEMNGKNKDNNQSETIIYTTEDGLAKIETTFDGDTVWLSIDQMAELFQRDRSVIGKHVRNIFKEGELQKGAVWAKFAHTAVDGKV